jgi:hypothetical protein
MYLVETKGYVGAEVAQKDRAATLWCENATALAGTTWRCRRVDHVELEKLGPNHLSDLVALLVRRRSGVLLDGGTVSP